VEEAILMQFEEPQEHILRWRNKAKDKEKE
jgi:hypothetical protein